MRDLLRRRSRPGVLRRTLLCCCLFSAAAAAAAQPEPSPLRTFGYFQNSLQYSWDHQVNDYRKTFIAQQLNLFFQKDLGEPWTAFVNFEVINNFSSFRRWGAISLEEAWIRYRAGSQLNFKAGLHVPPFNNLNEIKNRSPLLPYIIRPYVYEASLSETIETSAFLPERAFGQVYGFFPLDDAKLDYAVYVGNSPNVNNEREHGQTGADTSATYLVGGRVGVRYGELKAGVSAARDIWNVAALIGQQPSETEPRILPRYRVGGDLSYTFGRLYLESEFIRVGFDEGSLAMDQDLLFYYATLGYYATDRLFVYGSLWLDRERARLPDGDIRSRVTIPTAGASYTLNDMVTLKAQYANVNIDVDARGRSVFPEKFSHFSTAVSVVF